MNSSSLYFYPPHDKIMSISFLPE